MKTKHTSFKRLLNHVIVAYRNFGYDFDPNDLFDYRAHQEPQPGTSISFATNIYQNGKLLDAMLQTTITNNANEFEVEYNLM